MHSPIQLHEVPDGFPPARYQVEVEHDVMVPMRDGVCLATDVLAPLGLAAPLGTILLRTQYDKSRFAPRWSSPMTFRGEAGVPMAFAAQGFVVVVQDLRGLFASEGEYSLARDDVRDGWDTVDWICAQPWSNGKVGTYGGSSLAITQLLLARLRHPGHRCALAIAGGGALGRAFERHRQWEVWEGGAVEIGWALAWFHRHGVRDRSTPPPLSDEALDEALRSLPVARMATRLGSRSTDWEEWVTRTPDDPSWSDFDLLDNEISIDVPTLHVNAWHDHSPGDTLRELELFRRRAVSERARQGQFLIVGPGTHCASEYLGELASVGELTFAGAGFDWWGTYVRWFDHWLRNDTDAPPAMPPAQWYVMGGDRWRSSDRWPPPDLRPTRWYLHQGDTLAPLTPDGDETPDRFVADPGDPVPSVGGPIQALAPGGPCDQRAVEARADVLSYTSAPLEEDTELAGPVRAVLFVSADVPDLDVAARLVDVHPDGRAFDLCRGILRVRYRAGFDHEVLLELGDVARVELDLQATGALLPAAHRVRLDVSCSDFPMYDRNLQTGGRNAEQTRWRVARVAVHHSREQPSFLELPILSCSRRG